MYPELIGKMAQDTGRTYWLRCECGMLAITSRELHMERTVCMNCQNNSAAPASLTGAPPVHAMTRRTEGRTLAWVVAVAACALLWMGIRVMDAPDRAEPDATVQLG